MNNRQLLDVLTREGVLVAVNVRYQPVYLGERDEIDADDCTLERQHLKYKPAA